VFFIFLIFQRVLIYKKLHGEQFQIDDRKQK